MSGNFIVYLIGYIVTIIGVAYGLSAAGLGQQWIIAIVLIMAGLGIVYALSRSQRDSASAQATRDSSASQRSSASQDAPPPSDSDRGTA